MDSEQNTVKAERIYIRLDPESKRLLAEAANLSNETTSSFVRRAAVETALRLVREMSVLRLSQEDSIAFVEALDNPPPANKALRKAAKRYREIVS